MRQYHILGYGNYPTYQPILRFSPLKLAQMQSKNIYITPDEKKAVEAYAKEQRKKNKK